MVIMVVGGDQIRVFSTCKLYGISHNPEIIINSNTERLTINNALVTGLLIPNKCQVLRYMYFLLKPLTPALGRRPLSSIPIFKYVLATESAPPCRPGCPSKEQISSCQCPIISSSKNSNFHNSKHNSSPSQMAQMNLLQDKICVFLPYALGAYHSARHIRGAQRLSDGTEPLCPSSISCEGKGRNALLSFFSVFSANGRYLVTQWSGPRGSSLATHFRSLLSPPTPR